MRLLLISVLTALEIFGVQPALAQAAPFSMSPERPSAPAKTPVPQTPQSPAPEAVPQPLSAQPAARSAARIERPILPFQVLRFEGETDMRSWAFHLTQDEASSATSISVGYQNAVVIMPEASRLRVTINGESIIDTPIASSQDIRRVTAAIRPGLLHSGQNVIRMETLQRHRTDCTVKATYELWTDVDSASTKLIFGEGATKTLRSLEDLPSVGVDTAGVTTIRVVAPKIYRPEIRDRLLRLVQLIALRGRYGHPVIQVSESDPGPVPVGTIKVVMGVAGELRGLIASVPDAASSQPLAMMLQDSMSGGSTLVVSGPTWTDLDTAISMVGASSLNNGGMERSTTDTAAWLWPEAPTAFGQRSFRFADLGIPTQEFSGRRLRTRFAFNLPSDFYATEYGAMVLNLDTAYTSAIRPGSHIDIYLNGKLGTAMTVTSQGDVVRRHSIRVPMKNLKSGLNHVVIEAVLLTDADERCAPGETLSEASRFVLFDSSFLEIPNFGRIGIEPDLGALSAGGFPYGNRPATVVLGRLDASHYSAAGTLLARMARSAGVPVRTLFTNTAATGDEPMLFIGAVDQLPLGLLNRVKISEHLRLLWPSTPVSMEKPGLQVASAEFSLSANDGSVSGSNAVPADDARKRWSDTFQRHGILQQTLGSLKDWLKQAFNLSLSSFPFEDQEGITYEPPQRSTLLVAQGRTAGSGTWTLVTARTQEALAEEMARLTDPMVWPQVSGRAIALEPGEQKLEIQPISEYALVQTQPFSLWNLRLVAANWMSMNVLPYALLMLACCTFLGVSTYLLVNRLGRQPR